MKNNLWQGLRITNEELEERLKGLPDLLVKLKQKGLSLDVVLNACDQFSNQTKLGPEVADFCKKENLEIKIEQELNGAELNDFIRVRGEANRFESWAPLGTLVHVTPGNAPGLSLLALIEGLLTGNINILKISTRESKEILNAIQELCDCDDSGILKEFIFVFDISSKNKDLLKKIFSLADGLSAWGGDASIQAIRDLAPLNTRFISWGHKISFALVTSDKINDQMIAKNLAYDVAIYNQQACSSPQMAFVETDNIEKLKFFAGLVSKELNVLSRENPREQLSLQELAEITNQVEVHKLNCLDDGGAIFEGADKDWRILVDTKSHMRTSPLGRTLWIVPFKKDDLPYILAPWKDYLQTAGLAASDNDEAEWVHLLTRSGVNRILPLGEMHSSYWGEPHDGVYAVTRFLRRVNFESKVNRFIYRLSDFSVSKEKAPNNVPIMTKSDFQSGDINYRKAHLYFKSGGSSGAPALSVFSYRDYHTQMQTAAEGLFAAGFDPINDRVANLFFGGGLYGGFISFFTILEKLNAVQFPFSAHLDLKFVAEIITRHKINTLFGMPSYLIQLLEENKALFKEHKTLKKIFFGGEPFSLNQRLWLKNEFGIEIVKSASYGSVDAGPLGFQCEKSEGSIHHLNHKLQILEILKQDRDEPVVGSEIGRLVFTSKQRQSVNIVRYDVGDLGRWVPGQCECGRHSLRFELLGRQGDIFRAAGCFFNYQRFDKILSEKFNYQKEFQIVIKKEDLLDRVDLILADTAQSEIENIQKTILKEYPDLNESSEVEKSLIFNTVSCESEHLIRTPGSGKLRRVIDYRNN